MRDDELKEVSDGMLAERIAQNLRRMEELRKEQEALFLEAAGRWPQEKVAKVFRVSQQAVSSRLARLRRRVAHPKTDE